MVDEDRLDAFFVIEIFVLRLVSSCVIAPLVPAPASFFRLVLAYDLSKRYEEVSSLALDNLRARSQDLLDVVADTVAAVKRDISEFKASSVSKRPT
jgi:hypothetical protein